MKKVLWLVVIFIVLFSGVRLLQHYNFQNHAYDDGYNDNLVWNTAHGKFFYSDIKGYCTLGDHLDPILLAFVPFYWLGFGAGLLFVVQTIMIAIGAIPIYWLAKERLKESSFTFLFPLAYLLYLPTVNVTFQGFYQIALAIGPLCFAFYYLINDKVRPFLLWLLVALLCQEDVALIAAFMGIYILFKKEYRWLGWSLLAGGFALFLTDLLLIIPHFKGTDYTYFERYAYLGQTFGDKLTTLFFKPQVWFPYVVNGDKILYVIGLLLPVAFLPLFSPFELIPLIPALAINLFSTYRDMYQLGTRYPSSLIPFIFIAAILGLEKVKNGRRRTVIRRTMTAFMVISVLYFMLGFGFRYTWITPPVREGHELLAMIPKDAAISALGNLHPHLAHREKLWIFPKNYEESDYLILVKLDPTWPYGKDYTPVIERLQREKNYAKLLEFTFLGEVPKPPYEQTSYLKDYAQVIKDKRFKVIAERKHYLLLRKR